MRLTEAERREFDRSSMTAYEDGKGGWLFRAATLDEQVAVIERILTARSADMEARIRDALDYDREAMIEDVGLYNADGAEWMRNRVLAALLDAAPAGGAELKDAVTLDEAKKPCTCGHIRAAHFPRDGCLAKVDVARGRFCACDEFVPTLDAPSEVPHD